VEAAARGYNNKTTVEDSVTPGLRFKSFMDMESGTWDHDVTVHREGIRGSISFRAWRTNGRPSVSPYTVGKGENARSVDYTSHGQGSPLRRTRCISFALSW